MNEKEYMKHAIELAKKGSGFVNPNPMVGAVIVQNGEIIGAGYHEKYGELHAERKALLSSEKKIKNGTLYVTLEPCCHYGKTSPCTEAIIKSGIKKVVVGTLDPNPLVHGKGILALRKNNIEVTVGVLEKECMEMNQIFWHYTKNNMPFILMKYAMTVDGKIATVSGKSKWITGEVARESVHQTRHNYAGIMVGINTVIMDDPMLDCRLNDSKNPVRIICDTQLRIPMGSKIVKTAHQIPTYIGTAVKDCKKTMDLEKAGCHVIEIKKNDSGIDLTSFMKKMGAEKIDSIILEGGGSLNASALKEGLVNKVHVYIGAKIFGGNDAKTPVSGIGIKDPKEGYELIYRTTKVLNNDLLIEYDVKKGD
jgi:diaminohydroxyphosphoribosylaminopyrimidine deaminase/5-amino-6-(5-phosphoribosylamino)uracil reductase